eukprot:1176186-Prorocentrum_minimum.AAC.5
MFVVQNVEFLPVNAVLKMESDTLNDRVVDTLKLYNREWAFYQHTRHMIPLRMPRLLATVEKPSGAVAGLILEDLSLLPEATQMPVRPTIEQDLSLLPEATQMPVRPTVERE